MKLNILLAALIIAPLTLTACSNKNDAPAAQQGQSAPADEKVTPEQQAAIDALDKPVMDEKIQIFQSLFRMRRQMQRHLLLKMLEQLSRIKKSQVIRFGFIKVPANTGIF